MNYFKALSESEYDQLTEGVSLIAVLMAGADGNLEEEELSWGERVSEIRGYAEPNELNSFYSDAHADFSTNVNTWIEKLPEDNDESLRILSDRIAKLNPLLAKLDPRVAHLLYTSFKSYAGHIAKASGGFLRFFSVSGTEKKYIELPMLDEIVFHEEDE